MTSQGLGHLPTGFPAAQGQQDEEHQQSHGCQHRLRACPSSAAAKVAPATLARCHGLMSQTHCFWLLGMVASQRAGPSSDVIESLLLGMGHSGLSVQGKR